MLWRLWRLLPLERVACSVTMVVFWDESIASPLLSSAFPRGAEFYDPLFTWPTHSLIPTSWVWQDMTGHIQCVRKSLMLTKLRSLILDSPCRIYLFSHLFIDVLPKYCICALELSVETRARSLHVPSVIPMRTVASIPCGGVSKKSLLIIGIGMILECDKYKPIEGEAATDSKDVIPHGQTGRCSEWLCYHECLDWGWTTQMMVVKVVKCACGAVQIARRSLRGGDSEIGGNGDGSCFMVRRSSQPCLWWMA
ncbi:hypothetical protein Tco_1532988 [Tanacetum coccineum]